MAEVAQDFRLASGNVLGNDVDIDAGARLVVAQPGIYSGTYGTLTLAANGSYFYRTVTGSIGCTNTAFGGDPIKMVVKACDYASSTTAPAPVRMNT